MIGSAGSLTAEVGISGYGRTGVLYYENNNPLVNETKISSRLRMDIKAKTETDQGLEFGGKVRMQWDQGSSTRGGQAVLNAGLLWVTSNGWTVQVGNIDTAIDSLDLKSVTQLGALDRSVGFSSVLDGFFAYDSDSYENPDYLGVGLTYEIDDLTLRASYVDPSQSGLNEGVGMAEEFGVGIDYVWKDRLELSAGYVMDGAGIEDNNQYLLGVRYAVVESARIGMNYYSTEDWMAGDTVAFFGDYTLADGLTNIEAYISNNDLDENKTDNAFGIGVNYDLGGARLGASLQRDYEERVSADLGVRFNF
ncbi:porin [uncultured Paracoccus sp.]|uniref:porin n=1 Tax=uncultured Paracoccus sp. TaxID=189685 RepID=UPI0025CEBACB|nr:porin [uncultured Paracoccus sp.]